MIDFFYSKVGWNVYMLFRDSKNYYDFRVLLYLYEVWFCIRNFK